MLLPSTEIVPIPTRSGAYRRCQISYQDAPDREKWPSHFNIRVREIDLAKLLRQCRSNKDLIHRRCYLNNGEGKGGKWKDLSEIFSSLGKFT